MSLSSLRQFYLLLQCPHTKAHTVNNISYRKHTVSLFLFWMLFMCYCLFSSAFPTLLLKKTFVSIRNFHYLCHKNFIFLILLPSGMICCNTLQENIEWNIERKWTIIYITILQFCQCLFLGQVFIYKYLLHFNSLNLFSYLLCTDKKP